ncbi:MAG TPA: ergothioneine biosynthesis protein EgtB [Candidatus Binatia bacterium]|nr:ergothioneine biosynthesis protein EgtB [Candidatus Binatia bacterium]
MRRARHAGVVAPPRDVREPIRSLAERYREVRRATDRLAEPLSPEDCTVQSMPDASPVKWHLAHTTWFFETFVLERGIAGYRPYHPQFRVLFNSYYNGVGAQHPRPERGLLSRPTLDEVRAYRAGVDRRVLDLLERSAVEPLGDAIELGLHHEQQHQELILTDLKHMLSLNPLRPAYRDCPVAPTRDVVPLRWLHHPGGIAWIGHGERSFCFDNERPRHRVLADAFALASRPVTNGEYLEFVEDGAYSRPELWLSDGWDAVRLQAWQAPLYWQSDRRGAWRVITLSGLRDLRADEPVCHVSFYEADAFARWYGARLPSEAEWEIVAAKAAADGNFVEDGWLHPTGLEAAAAGAPAQLFGDVWEWTRSPYAPYPGYRTPAGALGEYNAKFMCNQFVLRGGSCATPRSHIRVTYRNFFPPQTRWQFSGIRLARDGAA